MLVLSRKRNQATTLTVSHEELADLVRRGRDLTIEVDVVQVMPGKVRLGFTAPRCVEIVRDDAVVKEPAIAS